MPGPAGRKGRNMLAPYKDTFRVSQAYLGTAHQGVDLVGIGSKNIYCPVAGTVVRAGWENPLLHRQGFGRRVVVQIGASDYYMYFGHLSEISVRRGQSLRPGQMIGVEGSTGHSTGSHLHWEIRYGDVKTGYRNIASYANLENVASRAERTASWGTELMGQSSLKNGQNDYPYCLYNAAMQSALGIRADGLFGSGTAMALRKFQRENGLTVDGIAGALTKAQLLARAGWAG